MMIAPRTIQRVLLVVWLLHGGLSYAFTRTRGLAYVDPNGSAGVAFVSDLNSSGGNDNIALEMGIVFAALGVAWAAIRGRRFGRMDIIAHAVLVALQAVYIAAVEVGSIATTILATGNWVLAMWVVTFGTLCATLASAVAWSVVRRNEEPGERR